MQRLGSYEYHPQVFAMTESADKMADGEVVAKVVLNPHQRSHQFLKREVVVSGESAKIIIIIILFQQEVLHLQKKTAAFHAGPDNSINNSCCLHHDQFKHTSVTDEDGFVDC